MDPYFMGSDGMRENQFSGMEHESWHGEGKIFPEGVPSFSRQGMRDPLEMKANLIGAASFWLYFHHSAEA